MGQVIIDDPPRMSLLGLILASIIDRNLAKEPVARRFAKLRGTVVVTAREQSVTMRFDAGTLTVIRGTTEHPSATVSGGLDALMGLALGAGMVGPVLTGRLKIGGNPFLLLKLRRLMLVG